jgi:hypothetical protein
MDKRLRDWITEQHEKMPDDQKRNFLIILKKNPSLAAEIVSKNLMKWATLAVITIDNLEALIIHDVDAESVELVIHFCSHFSKELQAIT